MGDSPIYNTTARFGWSVSKIGILVAAVIAIMAIWSTVRDIQKGKKQQNPLLPVLFTVSLLAVFIGSAMLVRKSKPYAAIMGVGSFVGIIFAIMRNM